MASYRTNGVPPKPEAKRRRRNKPASYGAARPTTAPAAEPTTRELGINGAHPLVQDMEHGAALVRGGVLLRDGLGAAAPGAMVRQPHDGQRTAVRSGLGGDPARAQRASVVAGGEAARGIELKRAVDVDEDDAVSMVGGYRQALKSV